MIYDEQTKRYYHELPCYEGLLKEREATRIENEQWDNLYQYIIKLHDLVVLPKGNITRLKDLRSGYLIKEGKKIKQWRTGPDFSLMLDAYKLAEDSIKWCIINKLNGSNDIKAINYCMSIMIDKLNIANGNRKKKIKDKAEVVNVKESAKATNEITSLINKIQNKKVFSHDDGVDVTTLFD